jgi:hypothetical protein
MVEAMMSEETKSLIEKLRAMERKANEAEFGASRLYGWGDAATLREAISALTPETAIAVQGSPSDDSFLGQQNRIGTLVATRTQRRIR